MIGVLGGYFGGKVDAVVMFIVSVRLALPATLVALAVVALFGGSLTVVVLVLGFLLWDRFAVVMRTATMQVRKMDYIAAAEVLGASIPRILWKDVLPNVMNALIVIITLEMAHAIILEAALSFPWARCAAADALLGPDDFRGEGNAALRKLADRYSGRDTFRSSARHQSDGRRHPRHYRTGGPKLMAVQDTQSVLSIRNLTVDLPKGGDRPYAVQELSLDIREREILCIVGESGSGKSITSFATMGLLPKALKPSAGEIWFEGRNLLALSKQEHASLRGTKMGHGLSGADERAQSLLHGGEQIEEIYRAHTTLSRAEQRRKTIALLSEVRLPEPERIYHAYPHQLSGVSDSVSSSPWRWRWSRAF